MLSLGRRAGAALAACLLAACGAAGGDAGTGSADVVSGIAPLEARDFAEQDLDKHVIRATNENLDDDAFEQKWQASHESSVMFMRAYPGAFHRDLAQIPAGRIPGKEDLCFGDAHPDNFGLLHLEGKTRFLYNDLDDSGYCLVALDAARYFAVLHLAYDDEELEKHVLEQYVDTLKDARRAKTPDEDVVPSLAEAHEERLDDLVKNDKLVLTRGLEAAAPSDRSAVEALFDADAHLRGAAVLDVARMPRAAGGSGGLQRFWVLVSRASGSSVLELKEAATPGTDLGRHSKTLTMDDRLDVLKTTLWKSEAPDDYFYVKLGGTRFLVRDRLAKKSITLADLGKDLEEVLDAEASLLALRHAKALEDVTKDDLRAWIAGSSKVLAKRWKNAM